jgi:hypothetical protein
MHVSPLAVVSAFTVAGALTGCDPGTSLRGEALTGFVNSTVFEGEVTRDVAFFFDGLTTSPEDCPRVPAGSATFDGEVVDNDVGGVSSGFLLAPYCNAVLFGFTLDNSDTRDGRLEIVSGDDTVSYVGENLVADRHFVADDGLIVAAGGSLRFHYAPSTDITSLPQAWVRDTPEESAFSLFANRSDTGDIVVVLPRDTPTGRQILTIRFDLDIPTVACEGFSSCVITGQHVEEVVIDVQAAQ